MPALISIVTSDGTQLDLRLAGQPLSLGRAADNTVRSHDRNVSRHHLTIRPLPDGGYELEDAGSSYGTFVNGVPVLRHALRHLDQVQAGDLALRFALLTPAAGDEPVASARDAAELAAARERIALLVEQQATLRQEVRNAQEEEDLARRERDEVEAELAKVRRALADDRAQREAVVARAARLEEELQRATAQVAATGDAAALQKQLREARARLAKFEEQVAAMEERDSLALQWKKELARLQELLEHARKREMSLTESVRPSMERIAKLDAELGALRHKLVTTEAELEIERKRR